jgi:hypothetical protein
MLKPGTPNTTIVAAGTAITATANGSPINTGNYGGFVAVLNVETVSGSSPSLTVKFQDSVDGTMWNDVPSAAFTAATAAGSQRLVVSNVAAKLRIVETVSGSSPSIVHSVKISGIG